MIALVPVFQKLHKIMAFDDFLFLLSHFTLWHPALENDPYMSEYRLEFPTDLVETGIQQIEKALGQFGIPICPSTDWN